VSQSVETITLSHGPAPIGPYSHAACVGDFITLAGTAGVDPASGQLAGNDTYSQARQILANFVVMLAAAGSDLDHVMHINVFMKQVEDFDAMNRAYVEALGEHRPTRTVIGVHALPKPGALLTMDLTAVKRKPTA